MTTDLRIKDLHPVTHVIFDMDGLLLDTETLYTQAISRICKKHGSEFTKEAKLRAMGRSAIVGAQAIIYTCNLPITPEQYVKALDDEYNATFSNVDYMPGAVEIVEHLKRHNIPQAVATGSKRSSYEFKTRGKEDLFSLFDHIVTASDDPDVKHGKPAPDCFLVAAQRFKSPPAHNKNVLVFEDSPLGVQAALAANMQVVWIPDFDLVDINSENPHLIIPSLKHFEPSLFNLPCF